MDNVCKILNEFSSSKLEEDLKLKISKIEQKYGIEINIKYYEHIYNSDDYSYYYYHMPNDYILYLMLRNSNLIYVSIKANGKVLCSRDF